jgi:hypothetical protein
VVALNNANPNTSPTTYYVYDKGNVALEFTDPDGRNGTTLPTLSTRYLFGDGTDQILAQEVYTGNTSAVTWLLTWKRYQKLLLHLWSALLFWVAYSTATIAVPPRLLTLTH